MIKFQEGAKQTLPKMKYIITELKTQQIGTSGFGHDKAAYSEVTFPPKATIKYEQNQ